MSDSSTKLKQAFQYYKNGQSDRAANLIQEVIQEDRNNANAWWMMANVLEDENRIVKSLERVLIIDPNHAKAKRMLARLTGEEDEKPKPKAKSLKPSKHAQATAALMKLGFLLFAVLIAIIPVLALTGYGKPPPDQVAQDYVNKALNGDLNGANNLRCPQRRMPSEQLDAMLAAFEEQHDITIDEILEDTEVDTSEMTFTIQDENETQAAVSVDGAAIITSEDPPEMSLNQALGLNGFGNAFGRGFSLIKEGHDWFVCM